MEFAARVPSLAARVLPGRHFIVILCAVLCATLTGPSSSTGSAHAAPAVQVESRVPMLFGSSPDAPDSQLQAIVEETVGELAGNWGVAVKKLDTGQYAVFNGDVQQVSASLYKMWVLNELYRRAKVGLINLDGTSTVTGSDAAYDASLGILRLNVGSTITFRQAAYLMITLSDNTSSELLVRNLGPDNINRFMQQNGLKDSFLNWTGTGDNLTTPIDVLREMELVATSQMVDAESSRQMVETMLDQKIIDLFPPGLPSGGRLAHKTGSLGGLLHDAGIVYGPSGPFVLVAMSSNLSSYATARENMPLLLRRVYDYFNNRPFSPVRFFPETGQSVGHDFLKFYNVYGGVETFGYPIGPEQMVNGRLVQQFERARMEWHPEMAGGSAPVAGVALGLLGQEQARKLNLMWPASTDTGTGRYFKETGHGVQGGFLEFWLNHGGERIFGLPISPEAPMLNPSDGETYTTQYFQRARFEYHPELPEGHRIVLGALGSEAATKP
ncbi:MAG: serine hydrolase [Chloroflexota bacterium]|nr:serine hydrolase [Chloroflexota bacterium]MDQ5867525.1 serine hydrolase [Chloroflexota bacterium]